MTGLSELFQHNRELSTQRGRGSDLPKEWAKPSGSTIKNCHYWQPETIAFRQFHMIPLYMLHRCYCHTLSYTYDQHLNPAWSLCTSSQATKNSFSKGWEKQLLQAVAVKLSPLSIGISIQSLGNLVMLSLQTLISWLKRLCNGLEHLLFLQKIQVLFPALWSDS